jgi:hypothetical protein
MPLAQVVLDPALAGLAKKPPGFPCGTGHNSYLRKLLVGILRSISAPKGLYKANNFSPLLKPSLYEWEVHEVGEQRVGRDEYVSAGNKDTKDPLCEIRKKAAEISKFTF